MTVGFWRVVAIDGSGWEVGRSPTEARERTAQRRLSTMVNLYGRYRAFKRPERHRGALSSWDTGGTDGQETPATIRAGALAEPVVFHELSADRSVDLVAGLAALLDCSMSNAKAVLRRLRGTWEESPWVDLHCGKCGQRVRLPRSDLSFSVAEPTVMLHGEIATCPYEHNGNTYWLRVDQS